MTDWVQEHKARVIEFMNERNEIVSLEDGFYYYWPEGLNGCLAEHDLRVIADHLEELNKELNQQIASDPRIGGNV